MPASARKTRPLFSLAPRSGERAGVRGVGIRKRVITKPLILTFSP